MSSQFHFYQPKQDHGLLHNPLKSIIAPRPIGWISSCNAAGVANLAPYSFFNVFADSPPIIGFCSSGWKDSVANIEQTGEFCWNLATKPLAQQMNISCADVANTVDEFELAGLAKAPSQLVNVPRVAASPASFECKLTQLIRLETADKQLMDNWLVLGEVVGVHIDKTFIKDGVYQTIAAEPILRAGGPTSYFGVSAETEFHMTRPSIRDIAP
ncbi:flavin reductase family protein [Shewanella avicenniae]|uniref:Flavin reductase family protein n=1 Tax=Shewanella avicenniae TaxID=2814294 RepID=A0ABX7QQ04_9GAMM|nr:flavin reductase family protein [Shewanella avicenniae]QSX33552.1 flavin reductase family protein [Shewanella avicenniae]